MTPAKGGQAQMAHGYYLRVISVLSVRHLCFISENYMTTIINYLKDLNFDIWLIIGFTGQFVFFLRFIVQWWYSEKAKQSVIPIQFWYLSIVGAIIIFVYAIVRKDPVFFVGQLLAILIYIRNLYFVKKKKKELIIDEKVIE